MAALDDILGGSGYSGFRKTTMKVSPPPIASTLQGAHNTVGSQSVSVAQPKPKPSTTPQVQSLSTIPEKQVPGADATKLVGKPGEVPQPAEQPQMSYVEMFKMLNPERPETTEEKAKREKREKGEAALAAVGDSISALSNLWFTSQYAPNAYDPSKGMSATTKDRWDKLRQEREATRRAYSDGYMRAMAMDEAKDREDRNWRHTIEREKIADERYEVKEARDKALADLNEQLKRHQITAAEYKAEQERIKAQFAEGTEQLKQENLRAGVQQKKAAAGASYASANASNARADYYSSGGKGNKYTLTIGNDTYSYGSKDNYQKAVERFASEYGVKRYVTYPDGKDNLGRPKYTTKRKNTAEIAAEVEREAANRKEAKKKKQPNPMGGGDQPTNGKKKNPMS